MRPPAIRYVSIVDLVERRLARLRSLNPLAVDGVVARLADIPGTLPPTEQLMEAIAQDKKVLRGALIYFYAVIHTLITFEPPLALVGTTT